MPMSIQNNTTISGKQRNVWKRDVYVLFEHIKDEVYLENTSLQQKTQKNA